MTAPDKSSLSEYGGEKADYAPATDPTTDRSASETNACFNDTAMMSRTSIRAMVSFLTATSAVAVVSHEAQWGNTDAVKPVIAYVSTGLWTITWPTSVVNELGETKSVNLSQFCFAQAEGAAYGYTAQAVKTAANVISVSAYDETGDLADVAGTSIKVFAI